MPDDLLSTLALTVFGVVGLALLYRQFAGRDNLPPDETQPLRLRGRGSETTRALRLESGQYNLTYAFPDDVLISVTQLNLRDGDRETLTITRGSGAITFEVPAAGSYALRVEPADESAAWQMTISPLGLPSGHDQR